MNSWSLGVGREGLGYDMVGVSLWLWLVAFGLLSGTLSPPKNLSRNEKRRQKTYRHGPWPMAGVHALL